MSIGPVFFVLAKVVTMGDARIGRNEVRLCPHSGNADLLPIRATGVFTTATRCPAHVIYSDEGAYA